MSTQTIESRVRSVIIRVFQIPTEIVAGELRMSNPPAWDSLGHMALVTELEKEFHVRFPVHALAELTTVPAIARAIKEYDAN